MNKKHASPSKVLLIILAITLAWVLDADGSNCSIFETGVKLAGWQLISEQCHQDFHRLTFVKGAEKRTIEISLRGGRDGEFVTKDYLVQPAPEEISEPLLQQAISARLRALERATDYQPILRNIEKAQQSPQIDRPKRSGFNGSALLLRLLLCSGLAVVLFMGYRHAKRISAPTPLRTLRYAGFYAVLLLPIFLLLLVVSVLAWRVVEINRVTDETVMTSLGDSFDYGEESHVTHEHGPDADAIVTVSGRRVVLDPSPDDYVITVFGASSIIPNQQWEDVLGGASAFPTQEKMAFPEMLETILSDNLDRSVRVFNYGVSGTSSKSINIRVQESFQYVDPDLVIIYMGHNDYTNPYQMHVNPHFDIVSEQGLLVWISKKLFDFQCMIGGTGDNNFSSDYENSFRFFLDCQIEPQAHQLLWKAGLFSIDDDLVKNINGAILAHFTRNCEEIIDAVARKNRKEKKQTRLLFITPVGNLYVKPYSPDPKALELFQKGLSEPDYEKRTHLLIAAKDLDFYRSDVRAKTALLNVVTKLEEHENVKSFDLLSRLMARKVPMGYESFYDNVHLKLTFHKLVAEELANHLLAHASWFHLAEPKPVWQGDIESQPSL